MGFGHASWVPSRRPSAMCLEPVTGVGYRERVGGNERRGCCRSTGLTVGRWNDPAAGNCVKTMALLAGGDPPAVSPPSPPRKLRPRPPLWAPRLEPVERLANRGRTAKLARCRALLAAVPPPAPAGAKPVAALMRRLTGVDIGQCPARHAGRLRVVAVLGPGQIPAPALDTS